MAIPKFVTQSGGFVQFEHKHLERWLAIEQAAREVLKHEQVFEDASHELGWEPRQALASLRAALEDR